LGRREKFRIYYNGEVIKEIGISDPDTEPYDKLLKLFYTDITQSIELGDTITSLIREYSLTKLSVKIAYILPPLIEGEEDYEIFSMELPDIPIVSGTRPLGYRREGIIVNPYTQGEELSKGTSVKINLKSNMNGNKIEGKAINIVLCDEGGNPLGA
jgi:hypothetical protein